MPITGFRLGTAHNAGNPSTATQNFFSPNGHILNGWMTNRNERHFYHTFSMRPVQILINNKWYTTRTV